MYVYLSAITVQRLFRSRVCVYIFRIRNRHFVFSNTLYAEGDSRKKICTVFKMKIVVYYWHWKSYCAVYDDGITPLHNKYNDRCERHTLPHFRLHERNARISHVSEYILQLHSYINIYIYIYTYRVGWL